MRSRIAIAAGAAATLFGVAIVCSGLQTPTVRSVDEKVLREYAGVYQWGPDAFLYVQMWTEFGAKSQLGAFDESGEIRALHPTNRDRFFAGPGLSVSSSIESRVDFQRDAGGKIVSLTWQREGAPSRTARRVEIERHEDVRFPSGDVQLAGTLIASAGGVKQPAIILVHSSGPQNRESILPFARFLIRHGVAVLGYDKRGVGGSTGDWNTASFVDLASDVVAAFEYMKSRSDIDAGQIGVMGVSQAGWIMPLAALRAKDLAFLISISGAGVPGAVTTIDHAQNEMTASGMKPQMIEEIIGVMKLQYEYARTGRGWHQYLATRDKLAAKMGAAPPDTFPGTQDHPYWQFMRRLYFYDPAPTLRQLRVPTLALFGELDNNIMAEKNKTAWDAALKTGGHRDYTLVILPRANHSQLEAKIGNNAEMATLQRFTPLYFTTIKDWLAKRIRGFAQP